ncbi:MAG: glutathione S-transferase N-terminal domain-containing protein [Erythrobacter sp.]|uniref:glutathione S-transferase N-terminal domain-containing protein n=1 Tax=Erythrobacter sp. TaxID=1042 RepID=UPI0025DAD9F6|nr:glutathione S-transferase N-terminal domain-containing protein [Erythrobacter sp.]MCM0000722.1 glutathione S-transferase N-terminal domain-containing protein [Erythrobacter sp.]
MTPPVLYSFRRCPYAMRARMALWAAGITVELREVKLAAKPPALLAASPKGTVPVLVLADGPNAGSVIQESLDIMRWALMQHDPESWLAREEPALITANDGPFKHHLDRAKYPGRYGAEETDHRAAALALLAPLEARLCEAPFIGGAVRGFTDIALFPFIRQFAAIEPAWFADQPLSRLQGWLESLASSALFANVMPKFAPWQEGDARVLFGPDE